MTNEELKTLSRIEHTAKWLIMLLDEKRMCVDNERLARLQAIADKLEDETP